MASGYEAKRKKQIRWHQENDHVQAMVSLLPKRATVLDVPVGTGRFLALYRDLALSCVGVDASEEMLTLAVKKKLPGKLMRGDATRLEFPDFAFDAVVCIRFLDLIDEDAMRKVVRELCRVAERMIVLTIRLGKKYVAKSNTATHDEKKFMELIKRCGWKMAEARLIFNEGWRVLRLERVNASSNGKTPRSGATRKGPSERAKASREKAREN